jgi:hypothetical protein
MRPGRRALLSARMVFSAVNRNRKLKHIRAYMVAHGVRSVLLVGVGKDPARTEPFANVVERGVEAHATCVVASGLNRTAGAWPNYVVCDGRRLAFADQSFDLVVSNAVVEHVGDVADQRRFVAEHARVGRRWVITTPNRAFPVESHTMVVGRHWSSGWRDRQVAFTRLLNRAELLDLLPPGARVVGSRFGPTFTAFSSSAAPDQR